MISNIKTLVQQFKVCWEVFPEQALVATLDSKHAQLSKEIRKIGYSLELYGTPETADEQLSPGSDHFTKVQSALTEIAESILPSEEGPCTYEIETDQSLSYSHTRGERPDVCVTIQILHCNNWDQPFDDSEDQCLKQIQDALSELGVCRGSWSSLCKVEKV
jgi:hypothetical protein